MAFIQYVRSIVNGVWKLLAPCLLLPYSEFLNGASDLESLQAMVLKDVRSRLDASE